VAVTAPGSIETDRWYDVKLELSGSRVRCYLDGAVVHDADIPPPNVSRLFATASRENASGQVILKVVNPTGEATEVDLDLAGIASLNSSVNAIILQGNPEDENSADRTDKVAPATRTLNVAQPRFRHAFGPNSLTVMRFEVKDQ
jgi:alpha-L-arabinofuranosidase